MVKKYFSCVSMVAFAFLFLGCSEKIEPGNVEEVKKTPVKAPVAIASMSRQPFNYEAVGTVKAKAISTLSSKILGVVKAVFVQGGDTVEQGQKLIAIDDYQVSAQLREAEAALAEARRAETAASAGAELAIATYTRYQNLMKDESASPQEFDEIKFRYQQAQAGLAAAKQRVKQAEASVSAAFDRKKDALILAPFNGKISAKMIDVGDLATPGKPLLILEKTGEYYANLELPETYIKDVTQGKRVNVVVQTLNTGPLPGLVEEVFPAADEKSRSFLIKVKLPDEKGLRTGMFARIFIPVDKVDILLIPSTAVIHSGQLTGIYIVDDQHTARFRLIRTGRVFGESLEVLSGLKEGDRYVVDPPPTLSNGARVEVVS
jgi:RND family efflux transporter MFP subunit